MQAHFINLIKIEFSVPLLLADYGHDVEVGGELYRADSVLLSDIGDVTEENQINTTTFDVTLNVSGELRTLIRLGDWVNVPITYSRAWYESGDLVDVEVLFKGRLIRPDETDGETTSTVQFECASRFIDWESKGGRYTNAATQMLYAPADRGFEHAGKERNDVKWGRD